MVSFRPLDALKGPAWARGTEIGVKEMRRVFHPGIGLLRSEGDFQSDERPEGYSQNQPKEKGTPRGIPPRASTRQSRGQSHVPVKLLTNRSIARDFRKNGNWNDRLEIRVMGRGGSAAGGSVLPHAIITDRV